MNIMVFSRNKMLNMIKEDFPLNTAVISFYDEGMEPLDLKNKPVAYISKCINDIKWIGNPDKWHRNDFEEIARFIKECESKGYDIICQCEYGVSRSSACAMAIKEYYYQNGIDIFKNYDYYPNQIFFNNIYNCLCNII